VRGQNDGPLHGGNGQGLVYLQDNVLMPAAAIFSNSVLQVFLFPGFLQSWFLQNP